MNLKANHNMVQGKGRDEKLLRYLKGNESESKSQLQCALPPLLPCCCVTSKVMNLKANHNLIKDLNLRALVVALPQR